MRRWICTLLFLGLALAQSYQELDQQAAGLAQKGNFQLALQTYQQSLQLKTAQLGDHPTTALGHTLVGVMALRMNLYEQATQSFLAARKIYDAVGQSSASASNLSVLGDAYQWTGQYAKALEAYTLAQGIYGPNDPEVGQVELNIALTYQSLGDYKKALELALAATEKLERLVGSQDPRTAEAYFTLADVYSYLGDHKAQRSYLERSLLAKEKNFGPEHYEVAKVLLKLSYVYSIAKEYPRALEGSERGLDILRKTLGPDHPLVGEYLWYQAQIYGNLKDYPKATLVIEDSIKILGKTYGPKSINVATPYLLMGYYQTYTDDYRSALRTFAQVLDIYQQTYGSSSAHTATVLAAMGTSALKLDQFDQALEYHQQALRAFSAQQALTFEILDNPAKLQYKQFNRGYADGVLLSAVLHKEASLAQKQSVLDDWLGYKGSVFAFENGIGLLQQEASPALKTRLEEYLNLRRQLARLYTITPADEAQAKQSKSQIEDITRRISGLERELSSQTEAFARLLNRGIGWSELAKGLAPDELYLDFAWLDNAVYVLSLDARGQVDIQILTSPAWIAQRIAEVRKNIEEGKPLRGLLLPSQELYRSLLGSLETSLSKARKLVISPDGPLAFLPFELLSDGKQFLLERFSIRYTPSGRDLLQIGRNQAPKSTNPAAVFGNPSFNAAAPTGTRSNSGRTLSELLRRTSFAALPGSEREARAIGALLGNTTQVFLSDAANQQNLQGLESPRVLHLATHGFFIAAPDIPNPFLRVGIALSGAKASALAGEEYGLLTALQLSALRLSGTELVVLSACETALGDVVAGEGVAGLNQAFFTAGARRVMLSLWKVPDQETAILMERFYQLWIGGSSAEEALRQTKLELMRQGLEPLKWAAFVLNGG